jgi:phosphoribosylglycinamide formyltransferase-1
LKILLLRADSIRHRYLASLLKYEGFELSELVESRVKNLQGVTPLLLRHFEAREQIEKDFFMDLIQADKIKSRKIRINEINSPEALNFSKLYKPDMLITFGCGILKTEWLEQYPNKILGIHLGLSPYYRGAGTNFFPFVNNELGAIGYTLMNLDNGIDTGAVIHQSYGKFIQGDSIHTVGTRIMRDMFIDIIKLINVQFPLNDSIKQPIISNQKMYKRSDFTEKSLEKALENIRLGCIDYHLSNIQSDRDKYPLVRRLSI